MKPSRLFWAAVACLIIGATFICTFLMSTEWYVNRIGSLMLFELIVFAAILMFVAGLIIILSFLELPRLLN